MGGAVDFLRLKMVVLVTNNYIHFYVFISCSVTFYTVAHSQPKYQEPHELHY